MEKTKIIVAGIGGVGGYFGGLLARYYADNQNIEINFIARGQHLQQIQRFGLKVIKGDTEFIAKPHIATDNPAEIGVANFIIVSCKSYDLNNLMQQLESCIDKDTIILPVLNGVDSPASIKKMYPDNLILQGCVYVISRLKQAGIIENRGNVEAFYFGLDHVVNDRLLYFENLLKEANIEATLSENISTVIWEKFIFISATATATSYYDQCIGEIRSDKDRFETLMKLVEEVKQVAIAKGIHLPLNITEKTRDKLLSMPYEATSSMHSDFKNKKPNNELESLTGYVINAGKNHNISTPTYTKLYTSLTKEGFR